MLTPNEAWQLIAARVRPLPVVSTPLEEALGYCLAEDVRADRDMPPADRSAMDGYAVRSADLAHIPARLRLKGEVAAGSPAKPRVTPGTCVRILTGANIPPGADAVVIVEETREKDGWVEVLSPVQRGANILRRGEDAGKGAVLLQAGTRLGPMQVAVCAAVGKARVKAYRRPRIGLLCTGQELRETGAKVRPHESRNSNGPGLRAALAQAGFPMPAFGIAPDDRVLLTARLRQLTRRCDVTLLTGGVSVGRYDFGREAVVKLGARVRFHGVAMKPGKPVLYATLSRNRHVFGLPGNPLSAMTTFYEFVLPALRLMAGERPEHCRPTMRGRLATRLTSKGGRVRYMLARLRWEEKNLKVQPVATRSSADLAAGGRADGAIVVPAHVRQMPAGAMVEFRPWRPLP